MKKLRLVKKKKVEGTMAQALAAFNTLHSELEPTG